MTPPLQEVAAALRDMLGPEVGIGVTDASADPPALLPQEATAVAGAVPKRQKEFAAGRAAARSAMGVLLPILTADDRAPIWPRGWQGSIAHCDSLCIAAASQSGISLGIDVEPADPLDEDLIATICGKSEISACDDTGKHRQAHLLRQRSRL